MKVVAADRGQQRKLQHSGMWLGTQPEFAAAAAAAAQNKNAPAAMRSITLLLPSCTPSRTYYAASHTRLIAQQHDGTTY